MCRRHYRYGSAGRLSQVFLLFQNLPIGPSTVPAFDFRLGCRGHGTQVVDGALVATVCGVIQRVNKLISVVPVKARSVTLPSNLARVCSNPDTSLTSFRPLCRYNPELGDVVIGRVTEV